MSPTPETITLYGSMTTARLEALRAAFALDMEGASFETISFGTRRVELIDAILRERANGMSAPRYGVVADPRAGVVRVHFGGLPLSWLNLTPDEARAFAAALSAKADELGRGAEDAVNG